jgi:hypothetical protein
MRRAIKNSFNEKCFLDRDHQQQDGFVSPDAFHEDFSNLLGFGFYEAKISKSRSRTNFQGGLFRRG